MIVGSARALFAGLLGVTVVGCAQPPVRWRESTSAPAAATAEAQLAVDTAGNVRWVAAETAPPTTPAGSAACPGSLQVARAGDRELYAVWWDARADSSAVLLAARSRDAGATWPEVAPVDTADRGRSGCRRPAPSVTADGAKGYVHVAYSMVAPGAPGVFFAHSMPGPLMFHAPVPIVYGERPGRTSVAASGDIVAVAYEDPNGLEPRVGLALSRTLGHTFEHRVPVSGGTGAAMEPRVALAGESVAVAWRRGRSVRGAVGNVTAAAGAMMIRLGEISGS
jgi:hypothetical protein